MTIDNNGVLRGARVHLVHQSYGDYVSGLVHGLHAVGLSVVVTTISSGSARLTAPELPEGVEHHQVALPRFRHPAAPAQAARAVRRLLRIPADVVHWQAAGSSWVDLAYLSMMHRTPNVVTVHDMQPHPGDASVLPLSFAAIHRLARRADQVTVHAPHIRRQAEALGVDPERVQVIPHGELASRYMAAGELPLPMPSRGHSVLFFGRAHGYKGLEVLWEAMELLDRRGEPVELVLAATGPSLDRLLETSSDLPHWCRLIKGHIPPTEVAKLFEDASMVALPYLEASQSGVAALAAGFGRPVVASAVPGLTDIVVDNETGLLVAPGQPAALADAIATLATNPDLQARLSRGAYHHAATELSWPQIGSRLNDVYRRSVTLAEDRSSGEASTKTVLAMVPGLEGGVDEAANYLMPNGAISDRWRSRLQVTRGMKPALSPLRLAGAAARLVAMRVRGDVDVVHLNVTSRSSTVRKVFLGEVASILGVPYVAQVHGAEYHKFCSSLPRWAQAITRRFFDRADHIFVLGDPFKQVLIDVLGVSNPAITTLRNAVPIPADGPSTAARLDEHASQDHGPAAGHSDDVGGVVRIFFSGRIGVRKGVWDLLPALASIADEPWSAVICGDGDVDRARQIVTSHGLDEKVTILGWQSRSSVDRLIGEADVFVLPSYHEGLSVSLLEAMANGLCCVATEAGAQGEVLVDNVNCLVAPPGDVDRLAEALRQAVGDASLRRRLGTQARRTVAEHCSIDAVRGQLLASYDGLVNR